MSFNDVETIAITIAKNGLKQEIKDHNILKTDQFLTRIGGWRYNLVIAGGYFTNTLQGIPFKDIDIFILNNDVGIYNELTAGFIAQQVVPKAPPLPLDVTQTIVFDDEPREWSRSEIMKYIHNKNIVDVINNNKTKAQYILTKYHTREELLSHFDYKHCKVSYVPDDDMLYINRETYDCIKNKVLKINNDENMKQPNQKYRLSKYLKAGWTQEVKEEVKQHYSNVLMESYDKLKMQAMAQTLEKSIHVDGFVAQTLNDIFARSK